ncbi:MAG: thioredoxin family protein [Candidatus Aenigmarchaeota archaeon]|nr:thioredoxin family protein [Candidatus Aenigmarchaeota archaeon]
MRKLLSGLVIAAVLAVVFISGCIQSPGNGNNQTGNITNPEIKTFQAIDGLIETVSGKPIIRMFSTTWCPHCQWIKDTYDRVAKEYADAGKIVAYHWELDTGDNTLTPQVETEAPASEQAVFAKFNPRNSIPTFVFGGKYYRIGNGYEREQDLEKEEKEFRAVIEELIKEAGPQ